jgi:hypothetical protein
MTAAEWKARGREAALDEAVDLELPSGMVIRARRPDPSQLLLWGHLPLGLAAEVGQAARAGRTSDEGSPDNQQLLASLALSRDLLLYCCVEPRISLTPSRDEIHPKDVPLEDALFLLRWAMRREEAGALRGFCNQRADVGSDGSGEVVRPEAVAPGGNPRSSNRAGVRPGGSDSSHAGARAILAG